MIKGLGRTVGTMGRHGRSLTGLGVTAAILSGFSSGVDSQDPVGNLLDLTTGSADFDEYALGTNVGMQDLFLPTPISAYSRGVGAVVPVTMGGAALGGVAGFAAGTTRGGSLRGRLGWGLMGGMAGMAAGGAAGFSASSSGTVNTTTINNAMRARYYDNSMPTVDGSMVIGMYNSRMG